MNTMILQARAMRLLAATALVALAAGFTQTVSAQPGGPGGFGGYGGGYGGHGRSAMMAGEHGLRWLDAIGASAEQKARIQAIWQAARTDLRALREGGRDQHQQLQALLAQPTIDARAIETLRQQIQARHEQTSKRVTQAMIDAAGVLSPDQRKQLAERMAQRRTLMERHRAERDALDGGGPRRP